MMINLFEVISGDDRKLLSPNALSMSSPRVRLIKEYDGGVHAQRTDDGDLLLHPARQILYQLIPFVV